VIINRLLGEEFPACKNFFNFNEKVRIKKTGTYLDGQIVKISGVASRNIVDTYIVILEQPQTLIIDPEIGEETYQSLVLPEWCLEHV
jgi:hypothetical protein